MIGYKSLDMWDGETLSTQWLVRVEENWDIDIKEDVLTTPKITWL